MVYRGRPSTGCKSCRERKIKCDETAGGCLKCAKVKIKCPGYDRNVDSFFRDETATTEVKAQRAKAKAIALRDARYASSRGSSVAPDDFISAASTPQQSTGSASPGMLLLAPMVDQGIAYFMSRYAIGLDQPSIQSEAYNKHLATNGFHPLVATSMTALGLAGVANLYQDTALKSKATKWYLDAINMTNNAITHPREVTSDNTLLGITLLSMFEAIFNEHTLNTWGEHVAGAAALVKLRGLKQFASPAGRRMYLHSVGLLTINCLVDGSPLPAFVQELNEEVKKCTDQSDPRTRFFFLQQDVINLRAEIQESATMSLQTILDRALQLDAAAKNVFEDAGPEWKYEEVAVVNPSPSVFGSTYHIYPCHATAQTWNWVRYTHTYIHDIIRNTILAGLATSPPVFTGPQHLQQLAHSIGKLQEIQSDILASVPQFLYDVPKVAPPPDAYPTPDPSPSDFVSYAATSSSASVAGSHHDTNTDSPSSSHPFANPQKLYFENFLNKHTPAESSFLSSGDIKDRLPIVRVSGGSSMLWALYIAGSMPTAERASQEFVIKCLGRFGREFGINQAKLFAAALRVKMMRPQVDGICPSYLPKQGAPYVLPDEQSDGISEKV